MKLNGLKAPRGAVKARRRVGRGCGSGRGGTAGRGNKGQRCRSGHRIGRGFEGGQMPLQRRMPKRGFLNFNRREFAVVNLGDLSAFDAGAVVDAAALKSAGLIQRLTDPVKVLGDGELSKALTVRAQGFSASARSKIEAAGGKAEVIAPIRHPVKAPAQEG